MTIYGPRVNVHPDRYGAVKTLGPNRLIVLHTSEGGETTGSAEALGRFLESPGDRIDTSDGSRYGASYHHITDTDRVLPAVRHHIVAFAAAGANSDGIHICFPGKAGQTLVEWLDANSSAMLHQCSNVMRDISVLEGIPLIHLTDAQIAAGHRGYCDHWAISRVYKRSTHTDNGKNFPWDVLHGLLHPPQQEDDMVARKEGALRILDTRLKPAKLTAGEERRIGVVPPTGTTFDARPDLRAVLVDIGVAETEAPGYITPWHGDGPRPVVSSQDFPAGATYSNTFLVPISQDAVGGWGFTLYTHAACHVTVDLQGWSPVL